MELVTCDIGGSHSSTAEESSGLLQHNEH